MSTQPSKRPVPQDPRTADLREIAMLTPFTEHDLAGERFARGNMLGGANPIESADSAPWTR